MKAQSPIRLQNPNGRREQVFREMQNFLFAVTLKKAYWTNTLAFLSTAGKYIEKQFNHLCKIHLLKA